jgi:hypothetical protein
MNGSSPKISFSRLKSAWPGALTHCPLTPSHRRDRPVGLKAAEVVQPHLVVERERAADARHPPVEAVLLQQRPLVERIAPALPGRGEIIRRNTRHPNRIPAVVELEDLRMRPHIRAVVADKDGHIAQGSILRSAQ